MLLRALLFLGIVFGWQCDASPGITRGLARSSIVPLIQRVLTHGEASLHVLGDDYKNAFLGRNVLRLLSFLDPPPHAFDVPNGSPHQQLHKEFYERIASVCDLTPLQTSDPVGRDEDMMPSVGTPFNEAFRDMRSPLTRALHKNMRRTRLDFAEGHFIHVAGVTTMPLVGIHMRSSVTDSPIRYICPIEYAVDCQNVGSYRREMCLLKVWAHYSDFYVVGIPAGVYVDMKIGLNAPQTFPGLNRSVYAGKTGTKENLGIDDEHTQKTSNEISHNLSRVLLSEEDIDKFNDMLHQISIKDPALLTEWFYGGRAQIYLGAVERYNVLHLGSIYENTLNASSMKEAPEPIVGKVRSRNYLTDPSYDKLPVDILGMLHQKAILSAQEWDEVRVLRESSVV